VTQLPLNVKRVSVPPVKCQGIKTKLVPFIFSSVVWKSTNRSRWIEPFVGSGVVTLNLAPQRAVLADINRHIIDLYRAIQSGEIDGSRVREFLTIEGERLSKRGADYYYEVRERLNNKGSPFDFIFVNRSCFNGVMRFNRYGEFNVPFGHKPQRFAPAYITKIVNQVNWATQQMKGKEWEFRTAPWREVLEEARTDDFVYLDPPYIGRHTNYVHNWDDAEAANLAKVARMLPCGFALSMWLENRHRKNTHIDEHWSGLELRVCRHFYHVGSTESLRNEIDEALLIKPGFATPYKGKQTTKQMPGRNTGLH
jgi:DNA adenine methylase